MVICTGGMGLELWQVMLMLIGAGAIVLITVFILRELVRSGRVEKDASDAKKLETRRRGGRIGTSCWVASVAMLLAVQRDLIEAAVPWHELLMVIGTGAVAFAATELMWVWCRKQEARSKKQEARSKKQEARSKKQEARSKKQERGNVY
ncbi:MAG: hypothetical protein KGZ92_09715 [Firmicutes bacterium]|nr:hypothetical protein [Dethiobacter sp.]MBS3889539.1 hypothetical protein [Bacillota bacterium]